MPEPSLWDVCLEYIRVVFAYWWALLAGGVLVTIDIIAWHKTKEFTLGRRLRLAIALCCVLVAQFLAYRNQTLNLATVIEEKRQLSIAADRQAEKLAQLTIPNLRGKIREIYVAPGPKGSIVNIVATVFNDGAQSYADNFRLIMTSTTREVGVTPVPPPLQTLTLQGHVHSGGYRFQSSDYLPRASQSIPLNGKAEGFLLGIVEGVPLEEANDARTIFTLYFSDARGKVYSVRRVVGPSGKFITPDYFQPQTKP